MKFLAKTLLLLTLASATQASWGSPKPPYIKWHEAELQRWLSDNNIPYPKSAEKVDLEKLVKDNWNNKVYRPYTEWEPLQLQDYLKSKGVQVENKFVQDKDWLVETVKKNWHETEGSVENGYENVKNWIFNSWTESQLKAFLDKNGIPNPNPRTRDSLLAAARENYQTVAEKTGQSYYYPGNWLYATWSESDLKKWLDERGYKVPQPTTRDKLVAAVRRNSRLASQRMEHIQKVLKDETLESWSDSQIKKVLDEHGINVPQGSTRNELIAIARRHKAKLSQDYDAAQSSLASAYGAATSSAGNQYAKATDTAEAYGSNAWDKSAGLLNWAKIKAWTMLGLAKDTANDAAKDAKNNAYGAADNARDAAENARDTAYDAAGKAKDTAYSAAGRAKDSAYDAAAKAKGTANEAYEKTRVEL